jgi:hypothetical protein
MKNMSGFHPIGTWLPVPTAGHLIFIHLFHPISKTNLTRNESQKNASLQQLPRAHICTHMYNRYEILERDNKLLQSRHKTSFENLLSMYYRLSPPLARAMSRNIVLKIFLRYALVYPIVFGIKAVLPVFDVLLKITDEVNCRNRS